MRARRRNPAGESPVRALPARSRVTVRRAAAPLQRLGTLAAALRQSRDALGKLQGELDAILAVLRDPSARPDAATVDRLTGAARAAGAAVAALRAPR
jgi:hypothetical protein